MAEGTASNPDDDTVIEAYIKDEISKNYLSYAMSVIVGRAIPDIRDGLKPVHRRILYSMHEQGVHHSKPHRKCARIVGDVIGKYHPHGDQAVYNALVRMAQEFSLLCPLVDGQGNFGSIDGDSPAAYRYTEARLSKIADEILTDLEKDTVPFDPNYDETEQEPRYLPARIPNLLVNGSSGIAVGMSTSIPPYNLGELLDAVIELLEGDLTLTELLRILPGPDFPTGGLIMGQKGIFDAYRTGRGKVIIRAKTHEEEIGKNKRRAIVVTEIPYMVNKAQEIEKIAKKINDGIIKGITDIRDESNRDGIRIVFFLNRRANYKVTLNKLFKSSRLQTSFHVINLVLDNNVPRVMNMKAMLQNFIDHREDIITRRSQHDLENAKARLHLIEGLLVALDNIDEIIAIIRKSPDTATAEDSLIQKFKFSEKQAGHILNMRLRRLTALELQKLQEEKAELLILIEELNHILGSKKERLKIIREECLEIKENYKSLITRKSEIVPMAQEDIKITEEDLIKEEDVVVIMTNEGYIKRITLSLYETQKRGGKGKRVMSIKEDDMIKDIFIASTHNYLLVLTTSGRLFWLKVYEIPSGSRNAKGKPIESLIALSGEEDISTIVQVDSFTEDEFLIMATKNGLVKKTVLSKFSNIREPGIRAITLREDDEVVAAKISTGENEIVLATRNGMACRFMESDIRPTGRNSIGVRGINLKDDDEVIGMLTVEDDDAKTLFTITKKGYGKRTKFQDYRKIKRGGVGVRNLNTKLREDKVIYVKSINEDDELLLVSKKGNMVRIEASSVNLLGRSAAGHIVMRFREDDDEVVGVGLVD
ncbi:DNA gyrase subunit A [Candidatus Bathyarchaeota archaeon]|nr:DNA gyrase subunit A [Candidatus Bathyarchaeota archaeon]